MRIPYETSVREYWIVDHVEKIVELFENVAGEFSIFSKVREKGGVRSKPLPVSELDLEKVF